MFFVINIVQLIITIFLCYKFKDVIMKHNADIYLNAYKVFVRFSITLIISFIIKILWSLFFYIIKYPGSDKYFLIYLSEHCYLNN